MMKAKIIKKLKADHFYARRNTAGGLYMVARDEVKLGEEYIELAALGGGAD